MIIDSHIHIGSWEIAELYNLSASIEDTNTVLDKCGIDGAIVFPSDTREHKQLMIDIKEKGTKKYWFFPWVNPENKSHLAFIEQNQPNIDGLKFHPSVDRIRINDKKCHKFLEFAETNNLPVVVHCGRWQEMASYKFALKVAEKYSNTNFILAHQGGGTPELKMQSTLDAKKKRLENVFFDISGTVEYWILKKCINILGIERFVFGSDFPLAYPTIYFACIEALELTPNDEQRIFGENLLQILRKK